MNAEYDFSEAETTPYAEHRRDPSTTGPREDVKERLRSDLDS